MLGLILGSEELSKGLEHSQVHREKPQERLMVPTTVRISDQSLSKWWSPRNIDCQWKEWWSVGRNEHKILGDYQVSDMDGGGC